MQYGAIRMQLTKISRKAGITKKIHPHLFRHSRATYMANYLTEAQMNAYFGWIQGSDMPSICVHLSGRDIDDAVLKANGIIEKDVSTVDILKERESQKLDISSII
jgi:integrase/recombinase XerD